MSELTPFALGTFADADGRVFPGLVADDRGVLDLSGRFPSVLAIVEQWDDALPELRRSAAGGPRLPLESLAIRAPIEPRQVFHAGANYRQHVIDLEVAHRAADDPRTEEQARAEVAQIMDRRAAEDLPYVFIGLPTAIGAPQDEVVLPAWAAKPDWELELVAVIGREAHRVTADEALDYVAGYTIANDLTDRATVFRRDMPAIGTDWLRSKNAPGFTPVGPYLVPAEFVGDPQKLQVTLKLNGETMQDESTADMLFGVARLIAAISETATLLPGDLVLTGSPSGNGIHWGRLLRDGDVMEGSITGLGVLRTVCVAEAEEDAR
ncbi:MAG TPA: fumarylacetoacetate hydrolase family protein [Actinospica sp.]|nr:fumarylacetoacetate hydrolase family protein [Actinospica sp.]